MRRISGICFWRKAGTGGVSADQNNGKIKEVKRLLSETDEKISEIGRQVGYENDKHFMKTFKSVCGISYSEYRKAKSCVKQE
ncbi:MAG: helix-turn-helix domain-containing protein [Fusicatenibacter sp.]|nr:helix-turn-helix domain-containing protein [Fusicatenibacter sp.]